MAEASVDENKSQGTSLLVIMFLLVVLLINFCVYSYGMTAKMKELIETIKAREVRP